MRRNKDRF